MNRHPALAVALLLSHSALAQTFILDDFETGDFSVSGANSFDQTLPEQNVLGGARTVSLSNTTFDTASVSDGNLRLVRNENSILTVSYGSFGDANPAQHLHFDAGLETTLDLEVPIVRREPLTVLARLYSFTIESGTPVHHVSTAEFSFRSDEPLRKSIPLADFSGTADLSDIAGFQLQLGDLDGIRTTLEVSDATLTAVPEPAATATVAALSLFLVALARCHYRS
jgi:hypothetical protein